MDVEGDGADGDAVTMMILMMPRAMTVTVVTIPPSEREFPRLNLPAMKVFLLSVVSVMKRRQKNSMKWLRDLIRSRGVSTPKGCRRRGQVPPGAHQARPRGARAWKSLGGPLAPLWQPFGLPW